jgi:tetratricopeptide (TPR) repeat protein
MKRNLPILMLLAACGSRAASQGSEMAAGRTHYVEGDFRKAAAHFQLALKANPDDAEACYWTGMSYQRLADIATPFGGSYTSKARDHFERAMVLAPGRREYRGTLFEFLLESADSSRTALQRAEAILQTVAESDPDYIDMRRRLNNERKTNSSVHARIDRVFLTGPRALYRVVALPGSVPGSRRGVASSSRK